MFTRIRQFLAPPVFADGNDTRIAALLNVLLLMLLAATLLGTAIIVPLEPAELVFNLGFGVILTGLFIWFRWLVRRGRLTLVSYVLATVLWLSITTLVVMGEGLRDSSMTGYFLVIALASLLLGGRGVLIYGLLSAFVAIGLLITETTGVLVVTVAPTADVADLMVITLMLLLTALLLRSAIHAIDSTLGRLRENQRALASSNEALRENRDSLEARTHELERRSGQLRAVTELSRVTPRLRDLEALCATAPRLIVESLALHRVDFYLLDQRGEQLVLRGSHIVDGQSAPLGRSIPLNAEDTVAVAAIHQQPCFGKSAVADDSSVESETAAQLALPITVGERLLGVLDLHGATSTTFVLDDLVALQGLSDQLGMALESIALFTQTQVALETAQRAYGEISTRGWRELLQTSRTLGFRSQAQGVSQIDMLEVPEIQQALRQGQIVQVAGDAQHDHVLSIPIKVRETVIGVVDSCKPAGGAGWTEEELELLQQLVTQLGLALEGARLYQDTQRRAMQERLVGEITARMRETLDLDTILQTATREIGEVLGLHDVTIRLDTGERG